MKSVFLLTKHETPFTKKDNNNNFINMSASHRTLWELCIRLQLALVMFVFIVLVVDKFIRLHCTLWVFVYSFSHSLTVIPRFNN